MNSNNSRSPSRSPSHNSLELTLNEVLGNAPAPWALDDFDQQFPLANPGELPQPYLGQLGASDAVQPDTPFWEHGGEMYAISPS